MTQANSKSGGQQANSNQKRLIMWAVSGVAVLVVLLAFLIPLTMSDGTEKLMGVQRDAAIAELKSAPHLSSTLQRVFHGVVKYRVENVYVTPQATAKSWCGPIYQDGKTYYSVVLSERTIFGIKIDDFTRHDACVLM